MSVLAPLAITKMPVTIRNDFVGDPRNHTEPTNKEKFVFIRVSTWIVVTISSLLSTILLGWLQHPPVVNKESPVHTN
jgi:hypothetical protein